MTAKLTFDPNPGTPKTNGWAVAALVVGIVTLAGLLLVRSLFFILVFGAIAAIALGADGIKRSRATGTGFGLALAGLILGIVSLVWAGNLVLSFAQAYNS